MTLGTWMRAAALVAAGAIGSAFGDDEEKVDFGKLPAPVKAAVKAKFPGAEWKEAARETEGGETFFEVSLTYNGDKYDVVLEPNGEIEMVEREILPGALPSAVLKTVKAEYPKGKIEKAEQLTDEDGDVLYEVVVATGKGTTEVVLSPKGKIQKAEKDEDEKGEAKEKKGGKGEKDEDDEKGEAKEKKEKKEKGDKDKDDDEKGEKEEKPKKDKD